MYSKIMDSDFNWLLFWIGLIFLILGAAGALVGLISIQIPLVVYDDAVTLPFLSMIAIQNGIKNPVKYQQIKNIDIIPTSSGTVKIKLFGSYGEVEMNVQVSHCDDYDKCIRELISAYSQWKLENNSSK